MKEEIKLWKEKTKGIFHITEYTRFWNYITNLQEENEKLKQPQIFIDTIDMEERYGQELYEDYLKEQLENYKQRNEKAIDFMNNTFSISNVKDMFNIMNELEDILKGDKDE